MVRSRAFSLFGKATAPKSAAKVESDIQVKIKKKRSSSVFVETAAAKSQQGRPTRTRKAPERFEPENFNFVKLAKIVETAPKKPAVKARRPSVAKTARPAVASSSKKATGSKKKSKSPERAPTEIRQTFLDKIDEAVRRADANLPKGQPIEAEMFMSCSFPDNVTVIRGSEGNQLTHVIKYDDQCGLLHMKPKASMSERYVNNDNSLVSSLSCHFECEHTQFFNFQFFFCSQFFFVLSGTLNVTVGDEQQVLTLLDALAFIKIQPGIQYKLENPGNEATVCLFFNRPIIVPVPDIPPPAAKKTCQLI